MWRTGPTYDAEHYATKIDHFVIPQAARARVTWLGTSMPAMRRLQVIQTAGPRDHCPVILVLDVQVWHAAPEPQDGHVDRDVVVNSLMTGEGRDELLQAAEAPFQAVSWPVWRAQMDEYTRDSLWKEIVECAGAATKAAYGGRRMGEDQEYADFKRRRMELLKERFDLRRKLRRDSEDIVQVQLELTMITRRCRRLRATSWKARQRRLVEEIWQSWRHRRLARMHRLRALLTANGHAPKKRNYKAVPGLVLVVEQWQMGLAALGAQGGLSSVVAAWDDYEEEHRRARADEDDQKLPAAAVREQVWEDYCAMVNMAKRRSCPPWAYRRRSLCSCSSPSASTARC